MKIIIYTQYKFIFIFFNHYKYNITTNTKKTKKNKHNNKYNLSIVMKIVRLSYPKYETQIKMLINKHNMLSCFV